MPPRYPSSSHVPVICVASQPWLSGLHFSATLTSRDCCHIVDTALQWHTYMYAAQSSVTQHRSFDFVPSCATQLPWCCDAATNNTAITPNIRRVSLQPYLHQNVVCVVAQHFGAQQSTHGVSMTLPVIHCCSATCFCSWQQCQHLLHCNRQSTSHTVIAHSHLKAAPARSDTAHRMSPRHMIHRSCDH